MIALCHKLDDGSQRCPYSNPWDIGMFFFTWQRDSQMSLDYGYYHELTT